MDTNHAAPSLIEKGERNRIRKTIKACNRCKNKRIRCGGPVRGIGACVSCVAAGEPACTYPDRIRRRGPGKSKERMRDLEGQIKQIEARLNIDLTTHHMETDGVFNHAQHSGTKPSLSPEFDEISTTSNQLSIHELPPIREQQGRAFPQYQAIVERRENLTSLAQAPMGMYGRITSAIIPEETERLLVLAFIEEACQELPFLDLNKFVRTLRQPESLRCTGNIAWWALLNLSIAIVERSKLTNDSFQNLCARPWGFFKNAFSMHVPILVGGCNLWGVQALLAMVIFMRGSADTRMTSTLLAETARQVQIMGLHDDGRWPDGPEPEENEIRRHLVWATVVLESDLCMGTGIPPSLPETELNLRLPGMATSSRLNPLDCDNGDCYVRIFRDRVKLAGIQTCIHKNLYSLGSRQKSVPQLIALSEEYQSTLDDWESTLGTTVLSGDDCRTAPASSDPVAILLKLVYYNCISSIYWPLLRRDSEVPRNYYQKSVFRVRRAARATIALNRGLVGMSFPDLWRALQYQVAAAITLHLCIIRDPAHCDNGRDFRALQSLFQFIEKLVVEESCDLQQVQKAISRLVVVAESTMQRDKDPAGKDSIENVATMFLRTMTHPIRVTQCLMGNIQTSDSTAARLLTEHLSITNEIDKYGPLCSSSLRSDTFGFEV